MGALSIWHILILLVVVLPVYFLPTIIALARAHLHGLPIFLVNLLTGWSFIGWVVALVWSVMPKKASA